MATKRKAAGKRKPKTSSGTSLVPVERIQNAIVVLRGHRVMLDFALAELYEVETKALNQAVRRNLDRFPDDFLFRLSREETEELNRSQSVTGSQRHRDPRYPPYAFTQEGVAMLSSVLRSKRAVQVNVEIMRAFVRLRQVLASHEELARHLARLERSTDSRFLAVFKAIRMLAAEGKQTRRLLDVSVEKRVSRRPIGFRSDPEKPE